ncbi:MAG TPA: zinc-dependent alcohol dehydrogenase family protein [Chitinophagales bacterium]|nr:zinc-dependent alcohol dehydrogenase family protein [Chitinophagales bacterium]
MKVWQLVEQKSVEDFPLKQTELNRPEPASDELLVKINATAICRTDLHIIEGDLVLKKKPIVPGHQIVGTIVGMGKAVKGLSIGEKVGLAWLRQTCRQCKFCRKKQENLCVNPQFNGWTHDGGFAEFITVPKDFVYCLPDGFETLNAAPLLCAGIIGYRSLRLCEIDQWDKANLGIYGFGAAGHLAIQIAKARGARVYVCTRDRKKHAKLAEELGADWIGDTFDKPPTRLDASIIFAPAGEIVPAALSALDKGGRLVLGGIHMSKIPPIDYSLIYGERKIITVTNNTRSDAEEFLREAAGLNIKTSVEVFEFDNLPKALIALKNDAVKGSAVVHISD